jgi:hypothetical protein
MIAPFIFTYVVSFWIALAIRFENNPKSDPIWFIILQCLLWPIDVMIRFVRHFPEVIKRAWNNE